MKHISGNGVIEMKRTGGATVRVAVAVTDGELVRVLVREGRRRLSA